MSPSSRWRALRNGEAVEASKIPVQAIEEFRAGLLQAATGGLRVAALLAARGPGEPAGPAPLLAVLADDAAGKLFLALSEPVSRYASLTPELPQVHLFERELHETAGVLPEGHPWLKPVRRRAETAAYFAERGEEVHEVGVGPIHAGIIEPGHFRFQCHGEVVHHLEIQLGYQHRGLEALLSAGPDRRSLALAESVCGDATVAHAWAHCMAREALADCAPSLRAEGLRALALELERLANHIGDLGAIGGDIGFLPATAYFGRMRGDFLNLLTALSGSRYGRGLLRPGGAAFDLTEELGCEFRRVLGRAADDLKRVGDLFFTAPSVISRLEETGVVSAADCRALGMVGLAARAAGADRDARQDHAYGLYRFKHIPVVRLETGDVYARAMARWLEAGRSLEFVWSLVSAPPEGPALSPCGPLAPERVAVSLVEGWRGEVCHVVKTDAAGKFDWYKVVDPSFHNWFGLTLALRGGEISDFPLCNKSFNLSYAGHDL